MAAYYLFSKMINHFRVGTSFLGPLPPSIIPPSRSPSTKEKGTDLPLDPSPSNFVTPFLKTLALKFRHTVSTATPQPPAQKVNHTVLTVGAFVHAQVKKTPPPHAFFHLIYDLLHRQKRERR